MTEIEQQLVEEVEYDPDNDTYRTRFTPETVEPSAAVITALSTVRRCDSSELEPLYKSIDTDSLNTLIDSASGETAVTFAVNGFEVTVQASGAIEISPP